MLPNANLKYFRMEQITLPYDVEKHMHEHWDLVYYGGLGVSAVDGISFSYLSGSYVVIPPWVPHMETSLAEGALYVVGFESDMGKNELPNELFFDDESQLVRKTLEAIGEEVKKEQSYYSERVNLLLRDLLLQTMRKCAPKAKKTDEKLDMLINHIHAYRTMEIDFKALANSLNYSYDYLRHYFKAQKRCRSNDMLLNDASRWPRSIWRRICRSPTLRGNAASIRPRIFPRFFANIPA